MPHKANGPLHAHRGGGPARTVSRPVGAAGDEHPSGARPAQWEPLRDLLRLVGVGGAAREAQRERLADVSVPTLPVAGREDAATPPAHLRRIADAVPDAALVELPGASLLAPAPCR